MKTMIAVLIMSMICRVLLEATLTAQTLAPQTIGEKQSLYAMADIGYGKVTFSGGVAGNWLTVQRLKPYEPDGYNPSFTSITSDFKPAVTKRADGKYEIQFVSDISERMP